MSEQRLRELLIEELRRARTKAALRGGLFERQLAVRDDPNPFRANHAGRRSGKSSEIVPSAGIDVIDAGRDEYVIIGAETQKKARALHWEKLRRIALEHRIPLTPNSQEGGYAMPNGARILFVGITDKAQVQLLRGYKMRSVRLDEVQTFAHLLPELVSSVLEPALGDTDGTCTLYGTPTVTRDGEWADICLGETPGWSIHHWDVRQNTKFPRDAMSMLQQVLLRNKWTWDPNDPEKTSPTFAREYLGLFVNDLAMQVYKFKRGRNEASSLPVPISRGFCTIGIDYATTDCASAWVVLWSERGSREIYVVEVQKHYNQLPDDAAIITKELIDRWNPQTIVGDGGGLGAPYVRAFNRRYGDISGVYVHPADKEGRIGQITIVNGELESGRLKLLPAADDLRAEMQVFAWKDKKKGKENDKSASDACDAARYACMAHIADIPKLPAPKKTDAELQAEAVLERQKRAREKLQGRGLLRS